MPICLVNHARWWMIWSESIAPTKTRQYLVLGWRNAFGSNYPCTLPSKETHTRCEFLLNEGCKVNHFDAGSESPIFYFERNGQSWCRKHWCEFPRCVEVWSSPDSCNGEDFRCMSVGCSRLWSSTMQTSTVIDKPGFSPFSEDQPSTVSSWNCWRP